MRKKIKMSLGGVPPNLSSLFDMIGYMQRQKELPGSGEGLDMMMGPDNSVLSQQPLGAPGMLNPLGPNTVTSSAYGMLDKSMKPTMDMQPFIDSNTPAGTGTIGGSGMNMTNMANQGLGLLEQELAMPANDFDQAEKTVTQAKKAGNIIRRGRDAVEHARNLKSATEVANASSDVGSLLGNLGAMPAAEAAKQGTKSGVGQLIANAGASKMGTFLSSGAGAATSAGVGLLGKFIQEQDKKDGNYSSLGAMGGGALQGAAIGSMLGPIGTLAGGAIGAGVGALQKKKFEQAEISKAATAKTDEAVATAKAQLAGRSIMKTFPVEGIKNQIYNLGGETEPVKGGRTTNKGIINAQNFLRQQGVEMPANGVWSDDWEKAYTDYLSKSDSSVFEPISDANATNTKDFGRIIPLNTGMLLKDVFDNQLNKITGIDLRKSGSPAYTAEEKAAMDALVQRNLEKGKYNIEYGDYQTTSGGSAYDDVGRAGGESSSETAKKAYDPAYNLKTTFGQAMIGTVPEWNDRPADTMVYDTYDFNNAQNKSVFNPMAWKSVLGAISRGEAYNAARAIGTQFGSKDGEGRTNTMITNRAHGGFVHPDAAEPPSYGPQFTPPPLPNDRLTNMSDAQMRKNEQRHNATVDQESLQSFKDTAGNVARFHAEQPLDAIGLDLAAMGQVPVVGEVADLANSALSAGRSAYYGYKGDTAKSAKHAGLSGLSLASAIPFVGNVAGSARLAHGAHKLSHGAHNLEKAVIGAKALDAVNQGYAAGGHTKNPDYLAEGGEMIQHAPGDLPATDNNGSVTPVTNTIARINGDKHTESSGGVGMSGEQSARIYSDQLEVPADLLKQLSKL